MRREAGSRYDCEVNGGGFPLPFSLSIFFFFFWGRSFRFPRGGRLRHSCSPPLLSPRPEWPTFLFPSRRANVGHGVKGPWRHFHPTQPTEITATRRLVRPSCLF